MPFPWLRELLGITEIRIAGDPVGPTRGVLNFVSGASGEDNPETGATDIVVAGGGGGGVAVKRVQEFVLADTTAPHFANTVLWELTVPDVILGESMLMILTLEFVVSATDGYAEFDIAQFDTRIGRPMPAIALIDGSNNHNSVCGAQVYTPGSPGGNQPLQIRSTANNGAVISSVQGRLVVQILDNTGGLFSSEAVDPA